MAGIFSVMWRQICILLYMYYEMLYSWSKVLFNMAVHIAKCCRLIDTLVRILLINFSASVLPKVNFWDVLFHTQTQSYFR